MELITSTGSLTIAVTSEEDTTRLGQALAEMVEPSVVIGLVGPLGAGKTRLVRAIAEALWGRSSAISSPTFVLIHEYQGHLPIYHFDAYRLKTPEAFQDLGVADYWSGGWYLPGRVGRSSPRLAAGRLLDHHTRTHRSNVSHRPDRTAAFVP